MAYDVDRFRRAYLPAPLPAAVVGGWRIVTVQTDRVRDAVDLRLEDGARALTVFVERRVEGAACFGRTDRLQISYYAEEGAGGVDDAEAGRVTRAVLERLAAAERAAPPEALDGALTVERSEPVGGRGRTLELRINRECNERCLFCNTPAGSETISPGRAAIEAAIARERAAGHLDVTFTGREPILDPALPAYLRAAAEAGYRIVRVQTNGSLLSHRPTLEALVDAGMNAVEVSLHTLDAPTFARLVGPPRLLDKTLAGLANLAAFGGVTTHLVVVLTTLNLEHLPAVLERAASVHPGIRQVTVSPMAPVGDGAARLDLVPRLTALAEPLRRALEVAAQRDLELTIPSRCGAPPCAMPPGGERINAGLDDRSGKGRAARPHHVRFDGAQVRAEIANQALGAVAKRGHHGLGNEQEPRSCHPGFLPVPGPQPKARALPVSQIDRAQPPAAERNAAWLARRALSTAAPRAAASRAARSTAD